MTHSHTWVAVWRCEHPLAEGVSHAYVCNVGRWIPVCECGATGYDASESVLHRWLSKLHRVRT